MSLIFLVKCLLAAVAIASQEPDRDVSPEITQAPRLADSAALIEPRQYFGHDLIGYEPYSNSCKEIQIARLQLTNRAGRVCHHLRR